MEYLEQLNKENKMMKVALERIESVYDWQEDLAGEIAHNVLQKLRYEKQER